MTNHRVPDRMDVPPRWGNQEEAYRFAMEHGSCMLDMEMGTGKTRVAIDVALDREDVHLVLVVCPKAVMQVWPIELTKYAWRGGSFSAKCCSKRDQWSTKSAVEHFYDYLRTHGPDEGVTHFLVVNYESVWRDPMGDFLRGAGIDMVILDESHRAKAAGSKVSKYLALMGKSVKYRMCLSGTPMANSPLDIYGQFRFLDRSIFGTNHAKFLDEYAVMGGPDKRFVVGFKNQQSMMDKFRSVSYTCRMSDVADRIKLPEAMPPVEVPVTLPPRDMRAMRDLAKEFIAECGSGYVTASNVLVRMLRMQQMCSGFCEVQDGPLGEVSVTEINTAKEDMLRSLLEDIDRFEPVVVFCVFRHDLDSVHSVCRDLGLECYELSGRGNDLEEWQNAEGGVLAVQIQAGAEGVDMTRAHHAVYYSLPHSLALYDQSKARLYRPGQGERVSFMHLVAQDTVDKAMYQSLMDKRDVIDSIKDGTFDFGYMKR